MSTNELEHLTNLPTRASFDEALERLFLESSSDSPCALIFADIDHFKKVNDNHGHQSGDDVLREVAQCLQRSVSGKGFAYRYGGEEFAVLLPNHTTDEALAVAERARKSAESMITAVGPITVSFGVAVAPSHASGSEDWLKKADEALYDAKNLGRNLVRYWGEPPPEPEKPKAPARKEAKPGTISDEAKEKLRLQYLRQGYIHCPIDQVPLKVHNMTSMGETGSSFLAHCPGCGFQTDLPGPGS